MVELADWGRLKDGTPVTHAQMQEEAGHMFRVMSYGATLTSIRTPDRSGSVDDVLLGFDDLEPYGDTGLQANWPYLGATVGRYANRIAEGRFTIDDRVVQLDRNEGANQNHGGPQGFDRKHWAMEALPGTEGVRLRYTSQSGEEGFPGTLDVEADFLLGAPGELIIRYRAKTSEPTHVNLASHGYFNLAGRATRTIASHRLTIAAKRFVPINAEALPVGELMSVEGTPFDLRSGRLLSEIFEANHQQLCVADGLNHCFCLSDGRSRAARLEDHASGRYLDIVTTEPGLQVYTANAFNGSIRDGAGRPFVRRQAIALEAQHYPDSPNRPDFPSTLLRPGETYQTETRLRFGAH